MVSRFARIENKKSGATQRRLFGITKLGRYFKYLILNARLL